jgi:fructose-bisphosphate aldolase class II
MTGLSIPRLCGKPENEPVKFVGLPEILGTCVGEGWAVAAFDTINLEITRAILKSADAERAPVIVMLLPSHIHEEDMPSLTAAIRAEAERVNVPVALLLDHATNLKQVMAGIRLGCSAVMFDASDRPLLENISLTRQVVEIAHAAGVSVEAELGHVGGGDESGARAFTQSVLTQVEEAERFVTETGVDALAVSIGTVHGPYITKPRLDFERLKQLRQKLDIPLVLHGGSGIPDEDIRRLITLGIDKINVWTDVAWAYMSAIKQELTDPAGPYPLHDVLSAGRAAAAGVVTEKMRLFGSSGKAV